MYPQKEEAATKMRSFPSVKKISAGNYFYPLVALGSLLLFNLLTDPSFFTLEIKDGRLFGSIVDIFNRSAPIALISIGMALVIATGGIDLSVGAVIAIAGAVCAYLIQNDIASTTLLIVLLGLGTAMLAGLWNGLLVTSLGIQPIIATLILMVAGRGIAQLITGGQILTFTHQGFAFFGRGVFLGIPFAIVLVLVTYVLTHLALTKTALGLFISSVGANPTASRYVGIREKRITIFVYIFSGMCAGLAGMILTSDIQGADANNAGLWSELDAILAVVIGGTALTGGRYYLGTTFIGVLILQTMTTTILTRGLPVQFTHIVKAAVVILVMLIMSPKFRMELKTVFSSKNKGG